MNIWNFPEEKGGEDDFGWLSENVWQDISHDSDAYLMMFGEDKGAEKKTRRLPQEEPKKRKKKRARRASKKMSEPQQKKCVRGAEKPQQLLRPPKVPPRTLRRRKFGKESAVIPIKGSEGGC